MSASLSIHTFEVLYSATATSDKDVAFIGLLSVGRGGIGGGDGITVHSYDSKHVEFTPELDLTGPYGKEKKVSYQNKDFLHGRKVEMTFKFDSANQVC